MRSEREDCLGPLDTILSSKQQRASLSQLSKSSPTPPVSRPLSARSFLPVLDKISKTSVVIDVLNNKQHKMYSDKVMGEPEWRRHRQAFQRHRLRPWSLVKAMLGEISLLLWVGILSVAVGLYDITLVKWYGWPMLSVAAVETFFSAITFALTLLLVFKTNSCYARWWEARSKVGLLTSTAHDLARAAIAYIPPHQPHLAKAMIRWTAATMWAVKSLVRPKSPLKEELQGLLMPEEIAWVLAQRHRPLAVGQALSAILQAVDADSIVKSRIDRLISTYTYEFGGCNRIYNTAIPSAYTRHTSRFLLCYIHCLPLLLWPLAEWGSPVLAVMISFLVLGIEGISSYIEEPFHVIAFDQFCANVQKDVFSVLAMHQGNCVTGPNGSCRGNAPIVAGLNIPMNEVPSDTEKSRAATPLPDDDSGFKAPAAGRPGLDSSSVSPEAVITITADSASSADLTAVTEIVTSSTAAAAEAAAAEAAAAPEPLDRV